MTAGANEGFVHHPAIQPTSVFDLLLDSLKWFGFKLRSIQIDSNHPAGVVQRLDHDAEGMFPIAVALCLIPILKPPYRVHVRQSITRAPERGTGKST